MIKSPLTWEQRKAMVERNEHGIPIQVKKQLICVKCNQEFTVARYRKFTIIPVDKFVGEYALHHGGGGICSCGQHYFLAYP